jgi:hypothetical protein
VRRQDRIRGECVAPLFAGKFQADAERWSKQIQDEYRDTILPQLRDDERNALGAVRIEVPLAGPNGDYVLTRAQQCPES